MFVVVLVAGYLGIVGFMYFGQDRLIYFPDIPERAVRSDPADIGLAFEDLTLTTGDGERIHAWYIPADPSRGAVIFFHGNAGNLSHRADLLIELATRTPASVFVVGYRGYGRSEGRPKEAGLYLDARAAWKHLTEEVGIGAGLIVIFGKSLGGGVAVDLAMEAPAAGLIVESSFTSIPDMAGAHYPFVPKFLVRTQMNSAVKVPFISMPKLFIHSREDRVVPYRLGRELFETATEPKRFYEVMGASHNETWLVGGDAYFEALSAFIDDSLNR